MKTVLTITAALALCFASFVFASAQEKLPTNYAGWIAVFPTFDNYQRVFEKPAVAKQVYQQAASYEWMGGRAETIRITLSRDADQAKKYTADGAKGLPDAPMPVKFGERDGYLWKGRQLVIALKDDRLVTLDAPTFKLFESDLVAFAKKLDLDACAKALEQAPRTDFTPTADTFKAIRKGMSRSEVSAWVGDNAKDIGSGIHILAYPLADGSRVLIGFPDFNRLIYVKHQDKDGKVLDIAK